MTDQELIKGFLNGGKREYNQVVGWISDVVRSKLWAERVATEDVIADTTLKLLLNLREDEFRLESSFKTYVQRITLYTLVDAVRRTRNADRIDSDPPDLDGTTPYSLLEEEEQIQLFRRVVGLLPAKCRQLWFMVFHEQLKCREIAARLGTTEGAVKTALSRCKEKARTIYKELTGNY